MCGPVRLELILNNPFQNPPSLPCIAARPPARLPRPSVRSRPDPSRPESSLPSSRSRNNWVPFVERRIQFQQATPKRHHLNGGRLPEPKSISVRDPPASGPRQTLWWASRVTWGAFRKLLSASTRPTWKHDGQNSPIANDRNADEADDDGRPDPISVEHPACS